MFAYKLARAAAFQSGQSFLSEPELNQKATYISVSPETTTDPHAAYYLYIMGLIVFLAEDPTQFACQIDICDPVYL